MKLRDRTLRHRIESALDQGRIIFHCQPIKLLAGGTDADPPLMFELLARLHEPDDRGFLQIVPAMQWIDGLVEHPDLLKRIDRASILHAIAHQDNAVHAVNLSAETLNDYGLLGFIADHMADKSVDRERIHFEVTESSALQPPSLLVFDQMRGFGFHWIGLDDFGQKQNGFSALDIVKPKFLKIDGAYCKTLLASEVSVAIVMGTLVIAQRLKIVCIAEMIENQAIEQRLREIHQEVAPYATLYGQGHEYGRPVPCSHQ
ncbi:EAL domain-containing protein [Phormidium sp. FACHB-592]|uniref:EAL domain-containing protein n=1 Tax=Stenomitos frigidus AS-A4 TaxID=2933935 RepID=A0ABV0KEL6_9CYAN|nr:EAL domain-containing protein [Phormidium sp. FACHB-592]MBD2076288.1 EAL domain-containing protein [Phormidium sp. FACHB-592]